MEGDRSPSGMIQRDMPVSKNGFFPDRNWRGLQGQKIAVAFNTRFMRQSSAED